MYDLDSWTIRNKLGVTYFLYSKTRSRNGQLLVKIGYTHNIRQRIKALSEQWDDIKIINLIYSYGPEEIETKYHNLFRQYRTTRQSEWFNLPISIISEIGQYNGLDLDIDFYSRIKKWHIESIESVIKSYKTSTDYICSFCGNTKNYLIYCHCCGKYFDKDNNLFLKQKEELYSYLEYQQRKWWFYEWDSRYIEKFENRFSD